MGPDKDNSSCRRVKEVLYLDISVIVSRRVIYAENSIERFRLLIHNVCKYYYFILGVDVEYFLTNHLKI